jgi:hypothetical protein
MGNSISVAATAALEETGRIEHPDLQFMHDIRILPDGTKPYVAVTCAHKAIVSDRAFHDPLEAIPAG